MIATTQLKPGQELDFYIQKGFRPGKVLAVIGQDALFEYTMPEGTTSMVFLPVEVVLSDKSTIETTEHRRNPYGYERLPLKWLRQMVDNKIEWIGVSQAGPVLPASDLLERRTSGNASRFGWIDYYTRHEREFRGRQLCVQVEVWGWTIFIDGEILGHLRKGLASLDLAKSLAVSVALGLPEKKGK